MVGMKWGTLHRGRNEHRKNNLPQAKVIIESREWTDYRNVVGPFLFLITIVVVVKRKGPTFVTTKEKRKMSVLGYIVEKVFGGSIKKKHRRHKSKEEIRRSKVRILPPGVPYVANKTSKEINGPLDIISTPMGGQPPKKKR